jgi:hypothetical protein
VWIVFAQGSTLLQVLRDERLERRSSFAQNGVDLLFLRIGHAQLGNVPEQSAEKGWGRVESFAPIAHAIPTKPVRATTPAQDKIFNLFIVFCFKGAHGTESLRLHFF